MEPRQLRHYTEGEYGALDLPDAWHALSLVLFTASLGARYLVRLLPLEGSYFTRVLLPPLTVFALAGVGLLCGLVGLRRPQGRGVARVGVFLNAIVLALAALAAVWFFRLLP